MCIKGFELWSLCDFKDVFLPCFLRFFTLAGVWQPLSNQYAFLSVCVCVNQFELDVSRTTSYAKELRCDMDIMPRVSTSLSVFVVASRAVAV